MHILFYDAATPKAYDSSTLQSQALGGTEASIIRIAQGLKTHHSISIAQLCRPSSANLLSEGIHYISLDSARLLSPEVVILVRQYRQAEEVAQYFPRARRYLWLHNMPSRELYSLRKIFDKYHYQLIAVSEFHRRAIEKRLEGKWFQHLASLPASMNLFQKDRNTRSIIPVHVLYNPINDSLQPDKTAIKADQLLFTSSPQKGLSQVLKIFEQIKRVFPEYQLLIANPGYMQMDLPLPRQARFLGALPHQQLIQLLRESFCVFYPQYERVETFGLVYAEANALGTPVLAHELGAAREVLSDPTQLVNGRSLSSILDKLSEWREQRPLLRGKLEFRLTKVVENWLKLLG